jgi:hypothetical protein
VVRGDSANDLPPLVADPNVTIHEGKAFTANLRLGRRAPRTGQTAEILPVPPAERTLEAQRPGPVPAPERDGTPVRAAVVPSEVVAQAATIAHRLAEESPLREEHDEHAG